MSKQRFVYLAESGDGTTLKIGSTDNPGRRASALRGHHQRQMGRDAGQFSIIFTMPGSFAEEREVLALFGLTNQCEWLPRSNAPISFFKENGQRYSKPKRVYVEDTKLAQFTFKFGLLKWMRDQAKRENVPPSVILNRALERERRDGSAA